MTDVRGPASIVRLEEFHRDSLWFDVSDGGPSGGPPVVLLHGWPGGSATWDRMAPRLHQAGLRTLAPDQRGYSPRARPRSARGYDIRLLADDVIALIDAAGLEDVHLVGHDWGGAVAWVLASTAPQRLRTVTVLSTPHPSAMARAMWTSSQALRSAYVAAFQIPILPEVLLSASRGAVLGRLLEASGLDRKCADAYRRRLDSPEAIGASLAWYRALLRGGPLHTGPAQVPTLYVWSSDDRALGPTAAEQTSAHVDAPYHFVVLDGVSHWIPEMASDVAADLVVRHVEEHEGPRRRTWFGAGSGP